MKRIHYENYAYLPAGIVQEVDPDDSGIGIQLHQNT